MEWDDDNEEPTARIARFRLEELIAIETEAAEQDDEESTIQEAVPQAVYASGMPSPVSRTEPPPSERTVIMSWANPIQERRFR